MLSITCPECGRVCSEGSTTCSCGHEFPAGEPLDSHPDNATRALVDLPDAPAGSVPLAEQLAPPPEAGITSAEPATPPRRRAWVGSHRWPIAAGALTLALLTAGAYGWSTNGELTKANGMLRAAWSDLGTTRTALAAETDARQAAEQKVEDLDAQVAAQSACIASLRRDSDAMMAYSADELAEWNDTAMGSALATAQSDLTSSYRGAAADFFDALNEVLDGEYTLAAASLDSGDTRLQEAQDALTRYNAAMDAINTTSATLDSRAAAIAAQVDETAKTCHFDTTPAPTT